YSPAHTQNCCPTPTGPAALPSNPYGRHVSHGVGMERGPTMGSISSSVVRVRDAADSVVGAGFLVDGRPIVAYAHVVRKALGIAEGEGISGQLHVTVEFPFIHSGPVSMQTTVKHLPNAGAKPRDIAGLSLDGEAPGGADPVRLVTAYPLWGHPFRIVG